MIRKQLTVHLVENMSEVLELALVREPKAAGKGRRKKPAAGKKIPARRK